MRSPSRASMGCCSRRQPSRHRPASSTSARTPVGPPPTRCSAPRKVSARGVDDSQSDRALQKESWCRRWDRGRPARWHRPGALESGRAARGPRAERLSMQSPARSRFENLGNEQRTWQTSRMPDYSLFGDEHVRQYEATGGKVGHEWNGTTCLILHTKGRRSGETRKLPLIYGRDGADYVVVASKGGAPDNPGWYR